ncbi:hypothetical protein Desac_0541 [Desulfobacca acetoxidans DSM 11109]|uniref:Uncharacterized protein n=1 Tax=Desulfobacca acetoxidans (strain ATCC 700848 / DSM 11109 / ASRB2) TaxID=880072 RepID=F2NG14_DESAR|nr:hypothetical protein Desac_0541 [Desulfobacca acetoxidans DSM 11109]
MKIPKADYYAWLVDNSGLLKYITFSIHDVVQEVAQEFERQGETWVESGIVGIKVRV